MANMENPVSEAKQFPAPSEATTAQKTTSHAAMAFIIITVLLDMIAFGIIAPVLPNLIIRFEGGDMARASDVTGYFGFAWNLMQFLFLPILGAWSDGLGGGRLS